MADVGDAVTLTLSTTTGASVTGERLSPSGTLTGPANVPETGSSGDFPYTFVPDEAGMWRVVFRSTNPTLVQTRWVRASEISTVPPLAVPEDITGRGHTFAAGEEAAAEQMIRDASLIIRQRVSSVDARLADGSLDPELAAMVAAEMVIRVLDNPPPGVTSWTVDDYTERYGEVRAKLWMDGDELDLLAPAGSSSGAFTIRPAGTDRTCFPYTPPLRYYS